MRLISIGKLLLILSILAAVICILSILKLEVKPPKNIAVVPDAQELAVAENQAPKTISLSPDKTQFSYVRVCPSPYHYQMGPEEWRQIRLYANDPEDAEAIQWILNEFEGTYSLNSVMFYQPASGSIWESLIFYDENDNEIDRITWKNCYEKGIYLTPNPAETFTLLYNNDIDWDTFYGFFEEYKHTN